MLLYDLLHLELVLAGEVEEVVHPVGGDRLEHGTPHQRPALGEDGNNEAGYVCV